MRLTARVILDLEGDFDSDIDKALIHDACMTHLYGTDVSEARFNFPADRSASVLLPPAIVEQIDALKLLITAPPPVRDAPPTRFRKRSYRR
jgi:hypothetical protein